MHISAGCSDWSWALTPVVPSRLVCRVFNFEERCHAVRKKKNEPSQSKPPAGTQAILRAIDVLRSIAAGGENGKRLTDVATELGLNVATAHRVLGTLAYSNLVMQRPDQKTYQLGPELISLAATAHAQFAVRDLFRPAMTRIAAETGDTVFLQIRSGDETICIARELGTYEIPALVLEVGTRLPLGAGAAGLAMLAYLPTDECDRVLERCEAAYEEIGLDPETVRKAVARSRTLGFGYQDGQMTRGVSGVAVVLLEHDQIAAAISVTAISQRVNTKRRNEIVASIRAACAGLPRMTMYPPK
ncbi:IclR family transcriptional regulator [Microbaculum marinum]|uniref:IclR family transcriptional regulator n=1 Tax=Microbaculum marinum TaxID=1764581 RepID=A0AAW9RP83_9HYPH